MTFSMPQIVEHRLNISSEILGMCSAFASSRGISQDSCRIIFFFEDGLGFSKIF